MINQYKLIVTRAKGSLLFKELWGPYDTKEQALAVLRKNEYKSDIKDIELKSVPNG